MKPYLEALVSRSIDRTTNTISKIENDPLYDLQRLQHFIPIRV